MAMYKASTIPDQNNSPKATGQRTTQEEGSKEVRRRKMRGTDETAGTSKKAALQNKTSPPLNILLKEVVTRNFSPS
jgi:hypothetical protein